MTEEEKRRLALSIMAAELQRQRSPLAGSQSQLNAALRRSAEQQRVLTSLAQQGITWQQLKTAYDEEFERGHSAMLDFHLSYLYYLYCLTLIMVAFFLVNKFVDICCKKY